MRLLVPLLEFNHDGECNGSDKQMVFEALTLLCTVPIHEEAKGKVDCAFHRFYRGALYRNCTATADDLFLTQWLNEDAMMAVRKWLEWIVRTASSAFKASERPLVARINLHHASGNSTTIEGIFDDWVRSIHR